MIFTLTQIKEMVDRGFNVLTRAQRDMVDTKRLYMPSGALCIIGQAFPGELFDIVLERLLGCTGIERDEQAEAHGFYVCGFFHELPNYSALQREWIWRLELERECTKLLEPVGSI